jgi:hypothetical protein
MIITTITLENYIPKALALADSVKLHDPKSKFFVCLCEKNFPSDLPKNQNVDSWILAKDLGFQNFGRHIISHDPLEGATSIRGMLFQYLFDHFPEEDYFVYIDPDIMVYSDFDELRTILSKYDIVITPHLVSPGNCYLETCCLRYGTYNMGFFGLRRSTVSEQFLEWWSDRLAYSCYKDPEHGFFTDQKWVDLVPAMFGAHILRNPSYNVATWTMINRVVTRDGDKLRVDDQPLRFIHFSQWDQGSFFGAIEAWGTTDKELMTYIGKQYETALKEHNQKSFGERRWSYAYLNDGGKISPSLREAFKQKDFLSSADPYSLSLDKINRAYQGYLLKSPYHKVGRALSVRARLVIRKLKRALRILGFKIAY